MNPSVPAPYLNVSVKKVHRELGQGNGNTNCGRTASLNLLKMEKQAKPARLRSIRCYLTFLDLSSRSEGVSR
jgi:hypothetical protein